MNEDTVLSVTAHIDLLGFSSHLVLSSYDLRTKIGAEAIVRLRTIETAINLYEKEKEAHPELYPDTFRAIRFNDSLIIGIDISPPFLPSVGKPNESGSFSYTQLEEFYGKPEKGQSFMDKILPHLHNESFKVAQFLGITTRIHNYINGREFDNHMPGCRTIIASGLRHKFIKSDNQEDFNSANFSLSNAYIANEMGSKAGFIGNKCYLENNVASICGYNHYVGRWLGFAKYIIQNSENDPFTGQSGFFLYKTHYDESVKFSVDLFTKKYWFREINTNVVSNFQLFPGVLKLIENQRPIEVLNSLSAKLENTLSIDTPTLSTINNSEFPTMDYPILFITSALDSDMNQGLNYILNGGPNEIDD